LETGMIQPDKDNDTRKGQWQETVHLLKHILGRYQSAREQLDKISGSLKDDENLVKQHLQRAVQTSRGYGILCLEPASAGYGTSQIGTTVLGGKNSEIPVQKKMSLDIYCLGPLKVYSSFKEVRHWQSMRSKSVFEYLITRKRTPVAKEILIETLWPGYDPRAAANNLKTAVYGLRQTLNQILGNDDSYPSILFSQGSYLINPEIELVIDAEEFERHWIEARRLEKQGEISEAMQKYEMTEALYLGDYLEDELYEEWTLLRREAIKDTYLFVLSKLADHSMSIADYESCIIYCQKILDKDPSREETYRRLMSCYSRLGQRNRALRWYENCCQAIQIELDTTPDKETTSLYNKLLKGESI
jgi:LuxR family maltose regulon positive regulatory protein